MIPEGSDKPRDPFGTSPAHGEPAVLLGRAAVCCGLCEHQSNVAWEGQERTQSDFTASENYSW